MRPVLLFALSLLAACPGPVEETCTPLGASEDCSTPEDDDCSGSNNDVDALNCTDFFRDLDGDGFGDDEARCSCEAVGDGWSTTPGDCAPEDDAVNPGADEVCGGVDEDCDGSEDDGAIDAITYYRDADGDDYGDAEDALDACARPTGYVDNADDCDDGEDDVYPFADELCNDVDDDCDGEIDVDPLDGSVFYVDSDDDGYGDLDVYEYGCAPTDGHVADYTDCDDTRGDVHPGATETCGNGDEDCGLDGDATAIDKLTLYFDYDEDGFGDLDNATQACEPFGGFVELSTDCDDLDFDIKPSADELCGPIDENCDGSAEGGAVDVVMMYPDSDGDGYGVLTNAFEGCPVDGFAEVAQDCGPTDALVHPGAAERCNQLDDDCNAATGEDGVITVGDANGDHVGNYTTLAAALYAAPDHSGLAVCKGTYTNTHALYYGSVDITGIHGSANTVFVGDGLQSVLGLSQGDYTLSGLTLRNGASTLAGGGLSVSTTAGMLYAMDLVIRDNVAKSSGGASISAGGGAVFEDVVIRDNEAFDSAGGLTVFGPLLWTGGSLTGNTAGDSAGGLYTIDGDVELHQVVVEGNTATDGGGIAAYNSTILVDRGAVRDNVAVSGGGIDLGGNSDVVSTQADWGTGLTDNTPSDVGAVLQSFTGYGLNATFLCAPNGSGVYACI